ncbi:MAG: hypothetical protein NDJ94_23430 [Vicinamibacteria bacterium]|nr:hypothetical protein [Vicinamibacteria bacterium]
MIPLAPPLLELARSIAPDDGALVVRSLRAILRNVSPFDAGELALLQPDDGFRRRDEPVAGSAGAHAANGAAPPPHPDIGLRRFPLEPGGAALGSPELVAHVATLGAPLRLDDLVGHAPAGGHLLQSGYRSLLALPLAAAGGSAGALLLVRRYAWAFVAAPLHDLQTIVGMAGLCLERSLWLSALAQHGRDLHAAGVPHPSMVTAPPAIEAERPVDPLPPAEPAEPERGPSGGTPPAPPGSGSGRRGRRRRGLGTENGPR